jgi:hypothetical protein
LIGAQPEDVLQFCGDAFPAPRYQWTEALVEQASLPQHPRRQLVRQASVRLGELPHTPVQCSVKRSSLPYLLQDLERGASRRNSGR